jgi:exopolysaccharide production protein ExoZ
MLVSVQYARAVAALLVVVAHLSGFSAFQQVSTSHFGGFGVDIFFVISGFIMWETSKNQRPADFMARRLARIAPPYWFYTALLVLLALIAPEVAPNIEVSWKALLGSYFFVPYTDHRGIMNPILLQGWTLNFEMYFYIIFALGLFVADRRMRFVLVALFFLLSSVAGLVADKSFAILSQITSSVLLEFVLGMMVSAAWQRWKIGFAASAAMIAISVTGLIFSELQQTTSEIRFIVFGIPSALLLFGLLGTEKYLARYPNKILLAAGASSYSLYLSHPFVLSAVHLVVNGPVRNKIGLDGFALGIVYAVAAITASLVVSHVSFILLEKPAGKFVLAQLSGNRKNGSQAKAATA